MEESVMYGLAVSFVMLGVPLWHSMGECRKGRLVRVRLCRWWLLCASMIMLSLLLSILVGVAGFVLTNLPPPKAVRLSTDCKILSKDVDLRSTRVCELGHVPHLPSSTRMPNAPSKFKCSLDYYWTSVFKVEYTPHASNLVVQAGAEAPREALPLKCRPGFGSAWRTKELYQINGTYPCKYSPKNLKIVDIAEHLTANCSIQDPSKIDLFRQFWYMLVHSDDAIFSSSSKTGLLFSRVAASVGLGICYSMVITGFTRSVCQLHFHFGNCRYSDLDVVYYEARLQLTILFTSSLFGLIWLFNHYFEDDSDIELLIANFYRKYGFERLWAE